MDDWGGGHWKLIGEVWCRTSLAPLTPDCLQICTWFNGSGNRLQELPGKGGDHFRCTPVELYGGVLGSE